MVWEGDQGGRWWKWRGSWEMRGRYVLGVVDVDFEVEEDFKVVGGG